MLELFLNTMFRNEGLLLKQNKLKTLLTIGVLVSPMVLSSYQALAAETATTSESATQSSATATSQTETAETQPQSEAEPAVDTETSTTQTTTPEATPEPVKTYNIFLNGVALTKEENANAFSHTDAAGNTIRFTYNNEEGLTAGTEVTYAITLKEKQKLDNILIYQTIASVNLINNAELTGKFVMPSIDVAFSMKTSEVTEQPSQPEENNNNSNSNNNTSNNNEGQPTNNPDQSTNETGATTTDEGRQPNQNGAGDVYSPSNVNIPTYSNAVQNAIVQAAYAQLGKPYVWGAKGPNAFDCSGLAYYVYQQATGHFIGSWTGDQQYSGTQIPVSDAQPGDLLFWGAPTSVTSHVAIYIGNGQYIQAPQPGDVVRVTNLADYMPTFAVRVNLAGLPAANSSLQNAFGSAYIFDRNQTTDGFIEKIGEISRTIGQEHDIYASVMIAQAILESGSGNSSLAAEPNFNLFGIKGSYEGQGVSFSTLEQDTAGSSFSITAQFRKYPSYKESLEDYADLIKNGIAGNSDFYKSTWKSETSSFKDATNYLQGRYATDKQYAQKLEAIIDAYDLTSFDEASNEVIGPKMSDLSTKFSLSKRNVLMTSVAYGPQLPEFFTKDYFVDLFRGDSIIALAASAVKSKEEIATTTNTTSTVYLALSRGLIAVLPPVK